MQLGVSLSEYEIKELIKGRVAELTGADSDELDVHVTCWNGRLLTCTTYSDYKKHLSLLEK